MARAGWQPQHLVAESHDGAVLGVAPCYLKSHSRGEYVFDAGWAEAYERAGGSYYPKLQVSVPFTPVTGRRLLARPGPHAAERAGRPRRRFDGALPAARRLLGPPHLPDRARMAASRRRTASCSATTSSSIGTTPATRPSRISSARSRRASARRSGASGATRFPDGVTVEWLTGADLTEAGLGCVLRLLHGDRLAQMGAALPHARVLLAGRREHARPHPAGDGEARRPIHRRGVEFHRLRHALSAATGARSSTTRSSISSSATTRRSSSRLRTSSPASRPAPRASTSWRAATCRPRPTRRTTSPIRACAGRSPITSSASAPMCRRPARSSPVTPPTARWRPRTREPHGVGNPRLPA